jgi:branched-chain amino acid transport system permease protein
MDAYVLGIATNVGLLAFLAVSNYVLLRTGCMSFGQQAFFGIGAYAAGVATTLWHWPLWLALPLAAGLGACANAAFARALLRLGGIEFSLATLALAESVRIALELFRLPQGDADGPAGPQGSDGFGGIRYWLDHGLGPDQFTLLVWVLLAATLWALRCIERSSYGLALRAVGRDPTLAAAAGIDARRVRVQATAIAGAVAAFGGALYAHHATYIEPRNFDIMLGIHALSYALIGGLGTPLGPLLGVGIDVVLLEGSRMLGSYRMIAFGAIVALLLIVRPRGLLDEDTVQRIAASMPFLKSRRAAAARAADASSLENP